MDNKITPLKKLIAHSPQNDPLLHYALGRLYAQSSHFVEAAAVFQKVLELKPDYSIVYLELGKILENLGQFQQAAAIYRQGIPMAKAKGDLLPKKQMEMCLRNLLTNPIIPKTD